MDIDAIVEQWEQDAAIDSLKLGDESLRTAKLHAKYLTLLSQAKQRLIVAKRDLASMKALRARYYNGEITRDELQQHGWDQYQGLKPLKSELAQRVEQDELVLKIQTKVEYYESCVEVLDLIMMQIKSRDWAIRNAIEWQKLQLGA